MDKLTKSQMMENIYQASTSQYTEPQTITPLLEKKTHLKI